MVHGTAGAQLGEPILARWWRTVDRVILACVVLLFALGLLIGFAASPPVAEEYGHGSFHFVYRQLVFGGFALSVMIAVSVLSPQSARRLGLTVFVGASVALLALPVIGSDFGRGATRWISFGFFSLQPSEFLKPGFVVLVSWLISASFEKNGPPGTMISAVICAVIVSLLVFQPDYGQAMLVIACWCVIYFASGRTVWPLIIVGCLTVLAGGVAYQSSDHFARRIDSYLLGEATPYTQIEFALNAFREGQIFGVGAGVGTVKWALPDAHTDFIIAVAAEEFGLVMVLILVVLFATICVRSILRLMGESDLFIRIAGTGLAALFGMQAVINLGVSVRLLPAKGMTLPFVSYGGSSLVAVGIGLGLMLAFTRTRPATDIGEMLRRRAR